MKKEREKKRRKVALKRWNQRCLLSEAAYPASPTICNAAQSLSERNVKATKRSRRVDEDLKWSTSQRGEKRSVKQMSHRF